MNEEERKGSSQDHRSDPSEWPARFKAGSDSPFKAGFALSEETRALELREVL